MAITEHDKFADYGLNNAGITASQEKLMGIIGAATDAIISVDEEQKVTLFNAAAERMFRCPAADAIGQSLSRFIPHRFRQIHHEHIHVFGETGVTTRAMASQGPLMALRADGLEFPVEATISQIVVGGQRLFTAIVRDVSERKRAEEALRESEERYRTLFAYAPDGILIADSKSYYLDANPSICRTLGYNRDELIGLHASDIVTPAEIQNIGPALDAINANSHYSREWQFRRKDGSVFAAEVIATLMPDGNLMGMIRDITDRKRAEETQVKLAAIVESSDDAIIGKTLDGFITTWNSGAEQIFGYTAGEAVGRLISLLIPQDRLHEEMKIQARLGRGDRIEHFETVRIAKDGRAIDVSLTMSPIRNSAGKIVGVSKILRDITARKRVEESLARQTEELTRSNLELERFAYVASHDLQEPMRTIQSFAQLLHRNCRENLKGDSAEYLRFIIGGVERMKSLINDLLAYSRVGSQRTAFVPADCEAICATVLDNLRASIEAHQAIVTVEPLPVVMGDATQLGQIFQNLLVNAIKFHGQRTPHVHVSAKETEHEWVFSISDNGIGIAPEYFERIFIIFQRLHTIEEYGGTGIGLAICKKIAEQHGGRIWVESVIGEGSTFAFSILKRQKGHDGNPV
jgi:PAS domain S-box-containing protein